MAAGDGLIVMQPTSIVVAGAGSSASINSDGGVDFTAVTSLSLNGVFVSGIDNYLIVIRDKASAANPGIYGRLRASGTDATGSNYIQQHLRADNTTVAGGRSAAQSYFELAQSSSTTESGDVNHVYGPFLAQPTAFRSVSAWGLSSAYIYDVAATHSLSTSYDGITIYPASNNITGNIVVFGYEE